MISGSENADPHRGSYDSHFSDLPRLSSPIHYAKYDVHLSQCM